MGTKEKNLIENFQQGDSKSFTVLYNELFPFLFSLAKKITEDTDMAECIVQDAFVELFNRREHVAFDEGINSIRAYMTTTIRHKAFRAIQKRNTTEANVKDIKEHIPVQEDPVVFRAELEAECLNKIRQQISHLSATEKRVFELILVEALTPEEAGKRLNLTTKTVNNARYNVSNALMKIKMPNLTTILGLGFFSNMLLP